MSPYLIIVTLTERGTDQNGNSIAKHTITTVNQVGEHLSVSTTNRRQQIGTSANRDDWATSYIQETFGDDWHLSHVVGSLPAGAKDFDFGDGRPKMSLVYLQKKPEPEREPQKQWGWHSEGNRVFVLDEEGYTVFEVVAPGNNCRVTIAKQVVSEHNLIARGGL